MSRVIFHLAFGLALVAVVVQGCIVPPDVEEMAQAARSACIGIGPAPNVIEDACHGVFDDDDKLKCYIKCLLEHVEVVRGDHIDYDIIMALMPPAMKEKAAKTIEACREITGVDMCDKIFNLAKCAHRELPEDFFIP